MGKRRADIQEKFREMDRYSNIKNVRRIEAKLRCFFNYVYEQLFII